MEICPLEEHRLVGIAKVGSAIGNLGEITDSIPFGVQSPFNSDVRYDLTQVRGYKTSSSIQLRIWVCLLGQCTATTSDNTDTVAERKRRCR